MCVQEQFLHQKAIANPPTASIIGIPHAPNYSASKHGIVGFMGAMHLPCRAKGIHIGTICPWFAGM
jgi:short-subunit dehydrogenase